MAAPVTPGVAASRSSTCCRNAARLATVGKTVADSLSCAATTLVASKPGLRRVVRYSVIITNPPVDRSTTASAVCADTRMIRIRCAAGPPTIRRPPPDRSDARAGPAKRMTGTTTAVSITVSAAARPAPPTRQSVVSRSPANALDGSRASSAGSSQAAIVSPAIPPVIASTSAWTISGAAI